LILATKKGIVGCIATKRRSEWSDMRKHTKTQVLPEEMRLGSEYKQAEFGTNQIS
jgi:hypothetical protein